MRPNIQRQTKRYLGLSLFIISLATTAVIYQNCGATGGAGSLVIPSQSGITIPVGGFGSTITPTPTGPGASNTFSFVSAVATADHADPTNSHYYHPASGATNVTFGLTFNTLNAPAGAQGNWYVAELWPNPHSGELGWSNFSGNTWSYSIPNGFNPGRDGGAVGVGDAAVAVGQKEIMNPRVRYMSQCLSGSYECRFFKLNQPNRPRIIGMKAARVGPGQACPNTTYGANPLLDSGSGGFKSGAGNQFTIVYQPDESTPSNFDQVCYYFKAIDPQNGGSDANLQCSYTDVNGARNVLSSCSEVRTQQVPAFQVGLIGNIQFSVTSLNGGGSDTATYQLNCQAGANSQQTCTLYPIPDSGAFTD